MGKTFHLYRFQYQFLVVLIPMINLLLPVTPSLHKHRFLLCKMSFFLIQFFSDLLALLHHFINLALQISGFF